MSTNVEDIKRRTRKPKPRHIQIIMGGLEENARMLRNSADSEGIGARISELLEELNRAMSGKGDSEDE